MKPTSLFLLFATTALATPQAFGSSDNNSTTTAVAAITPSSFPLPSTPTSTATGKPSGLQTEACKLLQAATAETVAHVAKLQAEHMSVPEFLSGYLMAVRAGEARLGC